MSQTAVLAKSDANAPTWSFRNKIINGDFRVAQRGVGAAGNLTTSLTYLSVDRWVGSMPTSAAGTLSQVAGSNGFQYFAKLGRTSGSALTNQLIMATALESVNSIPLQSQSVTLSFYVKAGTNFSGSNLIIQCYTGTGTDQAAASMGSWTGTAYGLNTTQAITTSLTRYSFTFALGTISQVGIVFAYTPTGTAGADDNIYITGVQLEQGITATPFEVLPYQVQLAHCQRYYFRHFPNVNGAQLLPYCWATSATNAYGQLQYPVPMRTAPTALEQSGTAADYRVTFGTTTTVCSAVPTFTAANTLLAEVTLTTASGLTLGQAGMCLAAAASSAGYFGWSAEL